MQCCYINLDQAVQRRVDIEASFNRAARPGWRLERFSALDTAWVDAHAVAGSRSRAEKACFLSHRAVIQAHAGKARNLLVLEDDATFGIATCEIVDGFLEQNAGAEWDLLFLDICASQIEDMLTLYFNREKFMRQRTVIPLDLRNIPFFGTNAYIVNANAFEKVLACIDSGMPIDSEYDIFLAKRVREGSLKAAVLFPFLTTLSQHANASQIQRQSVDTINLARNLFRNMMWVESNPASFSAGMQVLDQAVAGSGHEQLARILIAMCIDAADPGFNSDAA
jgi:GR25 family glycosyltransferase involved in LPS biosynthesis